MTFPFSYNKQKVIRALRYHFIWQKEIRIMLIVIILFDIISAVLYYTGKIQPQPFMLGSVIWFFFIISIWFFLPNNIYRKSATFKEKYIITFKNSGILLETERGGAERQWYDIIKYAESPDFFHLYFSSKSFFLVPKDEISSEMISTLRSLLKNNIKTF